MNRPPLVGSRWQNTGSDSSTQAPHFPSVSFPQWNPDSPQMPAPRLPHGVHVVPSGHSSRLIAVADGKVREGLTLSGVADALREAVGRSVTPADQPQIDEAVAWARAELGDEATEAARTIGRTLTMD